MAAAAATPPATTTSDDEEDGIDTAAAATGGGEPVDWTPLGAVPPRTDECSIHQHGQRWQLRTKSTLRWLETRIAARSWTLFDSKEEAAAERAAYVEAVHELYARTDQWEKFTRALYASDAPTVMERTNKHRTTLQCTVDGVTVTGFSCYACLIFFRIDCFNLKRGQPQGPCKRCKSEQLKQYLQTPRGQIARMLGGMKRRSDSTAVYNGAAQYATADELGRDVAAKLTATQGRSHHFALPIDLSRDEATRHAWLSLDKLNGSAGYRASNVVLVTYAEQSRIPLHEKFCAHASSNAKSISAAGGRKHPHPNPPTPAQVRAWATRALISARARCRRPDREHRGLVVTATVEELVHCIMLAAFLCTYSDLPLDFVNTCMLNTPSLERLDPGKGYTRDNVTVVCVVFNVPCQLNRYLVQRMLLGRPDDWSPRYPGGFVAPVATSIYAPIFVPVDAENTEPHAGVVFSTAVQARRAGATVANARARVRKALRAAPDGTTVEAAMDIARGVLATLPVRGQKRKVPARAVDELSATAAVAAVAEDDDFDFAAQ